MPDLLECLARMYPKVDDAARIAVRAGVPKRFVDLNGEANRFWSSLIEQARIRHKVERLVEVASEEFPENGPELRAAQAEDLARNEDLASIRDAKQGLASLRELLQEPRLRTRVIEFRVGFVNFSGQVKVLECYKKLHDGLHLLEYRCYNLVIDEVRRVAGLRRRRLPDNPDPAALAAELRDCVRWDNVDRTEIDLKQVIDQLTQVVHSRRLRESETAWVKGELGPVLEDLAAAAENQNVIRLEQAGGKLSRVIVRRPAEVNSRLFRAAEDLHMEHLVDALNSIVGRLVQTGVEPARLDPLRAGHVALGSLHHTLLGLVDEHNQWQGVDVQLRHIEDSFRLDVTRLEIFWQDVRQCVEALSGDDDEGAAQGLREDGARLEKAVAEHNPAQIERHFWRFRNQAANRFLVVDETLKTLCGELTKVADPVAAVLDAMGGVTP